MSKYDALREYLERSGRGTVSMSFEAISDLVGGLPPSAFKYREWWANEREGRHVQARAWIAAGLHVSEVNLSRQTVTFQKA